MKINKNNYEIYFIDYYDGNLSAEEVAELFLFLEKNPGHKTEFENFSQVKLETPDISFPDRDKLRKDEINFSNIQDYLVASLEGDLSKDEQLILENFLREHPQYRQDEQLYSKTISVPDNSIVYENKKSLKQPVPLYITYKKEFRLAIAAILLISLFAGSVAVFNRMMMEPDNRIAGKPPVQENTAEKIKESIHPENKISNSDKSGNTNNKPDGYENSGTPSENQAQLKENKQLPDPSQTLMNNPTPVAQQQNQSQDSLNVSNEKIMMADRIGSDTLPANHPEMLAAEKAMTQKTPAVKNNEEYVSVWEAIRQTSEKSIRRAIGKEEEVLAYADESEKSKIRLVDVVEKGMEKFSNDKVKMESTYNEDKQSNNFSFSVGKFKIEKK